MHIELKDGVIVRDAFTLLPTYQLQDGTTICGTSGLSKEELEGYGLFEVIDEKPEVDNRYFYLNRQPIVIEDGIPKQRYDIVKILFNSPSLVDQRLSEFAREKDIDLSEIATLLTCGVPEWEQEALILQTAYTTTWQAYYTAAETSDDWQEIEALLPVLSWETPV